MNGPTHRLAAGIAVGFFVAKGEGATGQPTSKPFLCGAAAAVFTNLPDVLEPATSPNHRQFFHSLAFAALLGAGLYKLYEWEPRTDGERLLKGLAALAGSAYLIHLALDATTRKSLPLLGKL